MQKVILDSNIIIYSFKPEYLDILQVVDTFDIYVSAISQVEVLGYHKINAIDKRDYEIFFASMTVYPVDRMVINLAIDLRQQKKMSLGDSIIASTALLYNLPLMTRNVADFAWIDGLTLINPFEMN